MANILVVDDSFLLRTQIKEWLEEAGHTVIGEAGTGIEAINLFRELRPEITTLDIEMPVMDGVYALKEMKDINPDAHILMVSSHSHGGNLPNSLMLGACEFIEKPLIKEVFMKTIRNIEKSMSVSAE